MLDQTQHQTSATAEDAAVCIEVDRNDIMVLLERKPHAGMDMLAVLGRQFHGSQKLVRLRSARNPNEVIEEQTTRGEVIADEVEGEGIEAGEVSGPRLRPGLTGGPRMLHEGPDAGGSVSDFRHGPRAAYGARSKR